ncbi:beta-phosphoglucomutase family hydrolase [Kineosporia rhizophila]|uniref:beta-phosphoglucomutase family hydrolase n=1 Tax=Kineosporia rhizophila TaxID=84633 RepID=UPI001E2A6FF2|nr:beta-phosphoglucomutase family hydrolase [Kineosporia rhizophila]MCE0536790.1 beta-phosphoglucomutase family hydrolase [Kineosporia rhizophila]
MSDPQIARPVDVGLPEHVQACLFDLDGVLTDTASVHASAWKEMFDTYLAERAARLGEPFREFDIATDYVKYVDGKRRQDGTRSFLASRDIVLPEGTPEDSADTETVNGLGTRKNNLVHEKIAKEGVTIFDGTFRYLEAVRAAGLRVAVVSSSANTAEVLKVTGIAEFVEIRVDAQAAIAAGLHGKPAPDTFIHGARLLGFEPAQAAVFEDAIAGVEAGRSGQFGIVVGVDRVGHAAALAEHGADVVVTDLAQLIDNRA